MPDLFMMAVRSCSTTVLRGLAAMKSTRSRLQLQRRRRRQQERFLWRSRGDSAVYGSGHLPNRCTNGGGSVTAAVEIVENKETAAAKDDENMIISSAALEAAAVSASARGSYPFAEVETKWQRVWERDNVFIVPEEVDTTKPKHYVLDMFPYPSGAGLHVGHPEGYTATDIIARFKRMNGFNVMHPMGWDAYGLPAEQYAIQTGTHPKETTKKNVDRFRTQLKRLGFSYDWNRELSTTDEKYYKWTQWIFLKLFEKGLAYQDEIPVNWCPALGTVLANEEVIDGKSERGGHPVIRRPMRQWVLKITEYAERLLQDLDLLDWPDSVKEMQANWIGKSEGAQLSFPVKGQNGDTHELQLFTTRPDTIFGVTFVVIAPEHPLLSSICALEQNEEMEAYVEAASRKSDRERQESKTKTGVFTGAYATNIATEESVPIYVSDYVLSTYGTGAIMAVPAHDQRDMEFAKNFHLSIRKVVEDSSEDSEDIDVFTGKGKAINSSSEKTGLSIDGMSTEDAKQAVMKWLEDRKYGERKVNYKLRDWLFSRQRYWGEPFPIYFVEGETDPRALPEDSLPLTLPPTDNFRPSESGESPLANVVDWVNFVCPETGKPAKRETNTMPQWAGSCWYYLRFLDPFNDDALIDPKKEKYWMPVDLYVGGAEHSVLHLLYARFWHKVLYDIGAVTTKEPFQKLVNQGIILGEVEYTAYKLNGSWVPPDAADSLGVEEIKVSEEDVMKKGNGYVLRSDLSIQVDSRAHKMSKSRGNVINPDDIVEKYGADSLRLYEMFLGPLRDTKTWSTQDIEGVHRFLARTWRLRDKLTDGDATKEQLVELNKTILRVTEDTEDLRFNTAIAAMMEFVNAATKWEVLPAKLFQSYLLLLSPYAPHIAEELWSQSFRTLSAPPATSTTAFQAWPVVDKAMLQEDTVTLPIQINGKVKETIKVPKTAGEEEIMAQVFKLEKIQKAVGGKTIKKKIFVPGRIVNIVLGK